MTRTTKSSYQS